LHFDFCIEQKSSGITGTIEEELDIYQQKLDFL